MRGDFVFDSVFPGVSDIRFWGKLVIQQEFSVCLLATFQLLQDVFRT